MLLKWLNSLELPPDVFCRLMKIMADRVRCGAANPCLEVTTWNVGSK